MPDITLTSGDDTYTQPTSARDVWNDYHALAGNDVLRVYAGTVLGGAGDDRIERLPSDDWWRDLNAAYWDSPDGVVVDLAQGWAQDGFGGRDTLVGVDNVSASNHDDRVTGNAEDNRLWGGGGHDTFNGAAGTDWVNTSWFEPAPGEPWRPPLLSELSVQVSVDGRSATLKPAFGHGFEYTLTDVEEFEVWTGRDAEGNNLYTNHAFGDFIRPADMAEQAVASGGDLRWNAAQALGSPVSLSFSFVAQAPASGVGKAGFRAFTAAEQQVVRSLLADTAALAGISFTEVSESGGAVGQLRFGVSQQAGTRGVSWQPNAPGAGDLAGDIWMDVESMLGLAPGSEGYAALLHEIGHALGLRHPRNADAGDDYAVQLREGDDR
ncbi:MAG TPA: hypothetical protein VLK61_02145, partial [Aquabacterium sp.]|nr:hypothetical protein [Aquabacterium sp.]